MKLLIIDDSPDDALLVAREVRRGGYEPTWERVDTAATLTAALQRQAWDVITCDWVMPGFGALPALDILRAQRVEAPVIIVSGEVGEEFAVTGMRAGAHDFVSKHRLARLCPAIERELRETEVRRARTRAERELRESEDRYRDLVEHSHDLICTHDMEGRILSVNPAPARALDYTPAELLQMTLADILAPATRDRLPEYFAALRRDGIATGIMAIRTRGGEQRLWEYTNTLRTEGVSTPVVRGMAHDVTEPRRAQRLLRKSEAYFRALTENALDLVSIVGHDGTIRYVSPSNERALGFTRDELIGRQVFDLVHPDDRARVQRDFLSSITDPGLVGSTQYRLLRKDGSWSVAEARAKDLGDDPVLGGVLVTARDISERALAAEQLATLAAQRAAILDALPAHIALLGADGRILAVNQAWRQHAAANGLQAADWGVGLNYLAACDAASADRAPEAEAAGRGLRAVLGGELPAFSLEYPCHTPHAQHWFRLSATPLIGAPAGGAVVMHVDVTDLRRAEGAARASEERFRALVEDAHDAVMLIAADGRIRYASPATQRLLGYAPAAVVGQRALTLVAPEDRVRVQALFTGLLSRPGQPAAAAAWLRHQDGTLRWIEAAGRSAVDNPHVRGVVLNLRDVTERQQAGAALRRQVRQQEALVALGQLVLSAPPLPAVLDTAATLAAEVLDAELSVVVELLADGETLLSRAGVGWGPGLVGRTAVASGAGSHAGFTLQGGAPVVVEDLGAETRFRVTPVLRDHGVVSGVAVPVFSRGRAFGVLAVYTRRARAFSPDEVSLLQGLGNTLAAAIAQERAERMEQHATDIVASVAHDVRAPLRTIDGFGRLLSEDCAGELGEQGRAHVARIRAATTRMQELIDGLLELARVTRGEPQRSRVDLSALAASVAAELHDPRRAVELVIAPDVQAHGDPRLLRIVLLNLLGNAWKYTGRRPRARIEFGATTADGATSYFVRDDGAGFDMAHADRLFAPFQRLHDAREFEGVGIGLATVERIIRHHGGRVWAESAPEQGATFYFTLGTPSP